MSLCARTYLVPMIMHHVSNFECIFIGASAGGMEDRQKILIVDDKKENIYLLEKILSETGAEIIKAANGNDALKATLGPEFALAILDVQMPGMDGYELAEFIR